MMNLEQCWKAVEARDRQQDGRFFFGVVTTGVYCRPSCPARHALRRNVRFYETPAQAERDGLRPCLRCHPLEQAGGAEARQIRELCRYIEERVGSADAGRLDLADLAARGGMSRFHLQRRFKAVVGVTPREYAEACRMRRLKSELRQAQDVTEAVYAAGFGSSSRVYERADTRLGMTPNQYRRGGEGMTISYACERTPVGLMMLAATDRGLCFLQFGESEEALAAALHGEFPAARIEPMKEERRGEFGEWMEKLREHLDGQRPKLELPLDIRATAFQIRVWNYLQGIPYGQVQSYGEVAAGIGRPTAVRAVARACSSNMVALVIPCHRVIRGSGEAGGYRWGLERKEALLGRERERAARSA
jgi:AraC family transcriptional regulator, regulatory protein of adaptative response / methylated-DNA-[protein]-cysteine methyltransferase